MKLSHDEVMVELHVLVRVLILFNHVDYPVVVAKVVFTIHSECLFLV